MLVHLSHETNASIALCVSAVNLSLLSESLKIHAIYCLNYWLLSKGQVRPFLNALFR